jgi:hypothetical protein
VRREAGASGAGVAKLELGNQGKGFFTLSRWSFGGIAEDYLRGAGFGGGADLARAAPDASG